MAEYVGQKFYDQVVELDSNSFDGCSFDGCIIRYEGGAFSIANGFHLLTENRFEFTGPALRAWKLMHFVRQSGIDLSAFDPDPER